MSDYFIKETVINAYTINAFAESIAEATKQGLVLDYDSARRIGASFSINVASQEEAQVEIAETQEASADQAESVEAQPADEPSEESGEESSGEQSAEQPFSVEDIEAASDSMELLKQLGDPVGVSARSKREMVAQLRAYIGEA